MSDYTGYESAFVPTPPAEKKSPNLEIKTDKPTNKKADEDTRFKDQSSQIVEQFGQGNVLNKYRSVTYNFTLAGLSSKYLEDPTAYRNSELELVILRSGGKGTAGISSQKELSTQQLAAVEEPVYDKFSAANNRAKVNDTLNKNQGVVSGFNKNSPGRFDMFIENVDIDTVMAPNQKTNASLATKVVIDVIEPYSVNGFIEALHVAAISAGYPNYISASYLLKIEFVGYPDDVDLPNSEQVPQSTRYLPIGITGIDVDITEKGTRYRVSAVPHNERAFGQPNVVKKPIKMKGNTVSQILENFISNINEQTAELVKEAKKTTSAVNSDKYKITFPSWSEEKGWTDSPKNKIADTKLVEIRKDNALYAMNDPAKSTKPDAYKKNGQQQPSADQQAAKPEAIKYVPGETVVQFGENMTIDTAITSVIRDSEYTRKILENIKSHIDEYGMVDYFLIKLEVTNQDVVDEVSKKPYQTFNYVVTPYKIHYTKIPNFAAEQIEEKKLKQISVREYNYIYTGKNIDVLDFKLNFNTLFFEALPAELGNKDVPSSKTGAGPTNGASVEASGSPVDRQQQNQVPLTPQRVTATPVQPYGGAGSQQLDDPYSVLARNMHESIINSKASMISGEIKILGDPLYIATSGAGNYRPKPSFKNFSTEGEVIHDYGMVLISINFRNPIDILPSGEMYFDPNRVPFSGVYMVTEVNHSFKEGIFVQRLKVLRVPGQILDTDLAPTDPSAAIVAAPASGDQVTEDSTRASSPSMRMDDDTALVQFGRGTPSPGLPNNPSNFTGSVGGLGGSFPSDLNRTYGLVSRSGGLFSGSSPIGKPLPTDPASNIRINQSGLAGLNQPGLASAALLAVAANVVTGNIPAKRGLGLVAGAVAASALTGLLKKPNQGSGIGEGATIQIPRAAGFIPDPTALDFKTGANINPVSFPQGAITAASGQLNNLSFSNLTSVEGLKNEAGKLVNGIGDKLKSLTASPADPAGIAASVGLNASALSGLGKSLPSKISSQLSSFGASASSDVNLSQAVNNGLVLNYVPSNKVSNIPATQPYATAPLPEVDTTYVNQVVAKSGLTGLENLYGVNNAKSLSSNLVPPDLLSAASKFVPSARLNPLSGISGITNPIDASVLKDKFNSAGSILSQVTGNLKIPDKGMLGSITEKFGSQTAGTSPLAKLIKQNDKSAPSDLNDFYG